MRLKGLIYPITLLVERKNLCNQVTVRILKQCANRRRRRRGLANALHSAVVPPRAFA
jgi:hypothetical protein